jgi:hypothetical protein
MKKSTKIIIFAIAVVIVAGAIVLNFLSEKKKNVAAIITEDIVLLEQTLQKINNDCNIIQFTNVKNPLTFLNVVRFVGSEIGTLNVARPEQFNGPYLQDNPSIYGIEYQVIKTKIGLYIVPGEGVKLPNGKIMGKDIVLDENSDIDVLLRDSNTLLFNDKSLGKKLDLVTPKEQAFGNVFEEYIAED